MSKYILVGLTEYAENHLSETDLQLLKSMIGCEVEESDNRSLYLKGKNDGAKNALMVSVKKNTHEGIKVLVKDMIDLLKSPIVTKK